VSWRAWSAYQEARKLAEQEGQHEVLLRSLFNLSWLSLCDGNADSAEDFLSVAQSLVATRHQGWLYRLRLAYCAFVRGESREALTLLQPLYAEVRSEAVTREEAEVLSWTGWLSGQIALSLGLLEEAEGFCRDGQAWSVEGGDARAMNSLSALRVAIMTRQAMASN
jgi:hypothetical protein